MASPSPTLADLMVPETPQQILTKELTAAAAQGLPTTAWQPVQVIPALLNVNATIASDFSSLQAQLAQGAYASTAAQMVDGNGNPITTWMDLRGVDQFNVTRIPATFAAGLVIVDNASATDVSFSPNSPLHFQNLVTLATYTTTGTGTVFGHTTGTTVQVQADVVGSGSTSAAGIVLALTTPLAGVSTEPLTDSLVGSDAESNANYLTRCQESLAAISPNGALDAYNFIAKSIPQGTPSGAPPYAVSSVITRTSTQGINGVVNVFLANAAGAPSPTDTAIVGQCLQQQSTPFAVALTVQGAANDTITVSYGVLVKSSSGLTTAQIQSNIDSDLALLFATIPIGGYTNPSVPGAINYLPLALVLDVVVNANPGTIDGFVLLNGFLANASVPSNAVAVLALGTKSVGFA